MIGKFLDRLKLSRGAIHRNDRIGAVHRAWGHVFTNHIRGDYLEFGVYRGDGLIESYRQWLTFQKWLEGQTRSDEQWRVDAALEFIEYSPSFIGFDTFDGMPANQENGVTFSEGTFKASMTEVETRCKKAGLSPVLICGNFNEQKAVNTPAAVINIDCDLYQSTCDALKIAESSFQQGTVLLMDDWNAFSADNAKGERRALAEFCATTGLKVDPWFSYLYAGQAFICHR